MIALSDGSAAPFWGDRVLRALVAEYLAGKGVETAIGKGRDAETME